VDYAAYAQEVVAFERDYEKQRKIAAEARPLDPGSETVRNPRALCISSPQFMQLGLENQIESVLAAFPSDVDHQRVFDSATVRRLLSEETFDIVHVAAFVCPRSGNVSATSILSLESRACRPRSMRSRPRTSCRCSMPPGRGSR
jgi:hypothetical protein